MLAVQNWHGATVGGVSVPASHQDKQYVGWTRAEQAKTLRWGTEQIFAAEDRGTSKRIRIHVALLCIELNIAFVIHPSNHGEACHHESNCKQDVSEITAALHLSKCSSCRHCTHGKQSIPD